MIRGSCKANHREVLVVGVLVEGEKVFEYDSVSFIENHDTTFDSRINLSCGRVNDTFSPIQTTGTSKFNHSLVRLSIALHQSFVLEDYVDLVISEFQQSNG